MSVYTVNYDLRQPGRNYQPLWDRLGQWGGVRALESLWIVNTTTSAEALRDDLRRYMDANDGILVASIGDQWASFNVNSASVPLLRAA
jgi:hypothetical protein